ncbi:MAG TPA: DUF1801 domain-containing protein [Chryseosolibacter sp.]
MSAKAVDEMLATLPRKELILVNRLRALVAECIPKAEEKAYYGEGIPFYRNNKLICFIWPASVFWGPKRTPETQKAKGTALGFNQGYLMSNEDGALLAEGRKQVYVMYFQSLDDIDEAQVKALLFEAALIDETFKKSKKSRTQKPR